MDDGSISFTGANHTQNDSASAVAHVHFAGSHIGDCGDNEIVTAVMTGSDGSSYTFAVSNTAFFSAAGQSIDQEITKTVDTYTVVVSMSAPNAQDVATHQAMTESTGFNNILVASETFVGSSAPAVCNVIA